MRTEHSVFEVYTPAKQATINFVEREQLNDRLVDALRTPGKQIVVYGSSGSGKSTLLYNKLLQLYSHHISTPCDSRTTFDQLLLNAFDKLDCFYTSASKSKSNVGNTSALEASYAGVKATMGASRSQENEVSSARFVTPQLTVEQLAEFMGSVGACWVVEDFHKIAPEHKASLAQAMKIFYDVAPRYGSVRIIVIGAVGTARELVEYDSDMHSRVTEIHVPLMTSSELETIIDNGAKLLNILIPPQVRDQCVHYSAGLAAVCHQLALNMCLRRGIVATVEQQVLLDGDDLVGAVSRYVEDSSDTLKGVFEVALRRRRIRKFDNSMIILSTLARGPSEGMTNTDLYQAIRRTHPDYPQSNLGLYLRRLQSPLHSEILRFDPRSERYSYAVPLYQAYALALFGQGNVLTSGGSVSIGESTAASIVITGNLNRIVAAGDDG